MNIKKAHILFSLCLALGMGCQAGGDKSSADTFYDNIDYKGIRLFNLFDDYPSIKSGFQSLEPISFNLKLESSMTIPYREDIVGFLRVSGDLLLKPEAHVRQSLLRVHSLLDRIENAPNNAFDTLQPWLESLRNYRKPVLRNMAPLSQTALKYMYTTYSKEAMETKFKEVSVILKDPEIKILFVELEDVLDKAINQNTNAKAAIKGLLQGMVDPSLIADRVMKEKLIQMISAVGKSFRQRAGFSDAKSSETVLKNLVVNLEYYFTASAPTGDDVNLYSDPSFADYRDATYPAELSSILSESFRYLRPMLGKGGNFTADPNVLLSLEMAKNFAKFDFSTSITGVDHSLRELIRLDANGLDRSNPANVTSSPVTALESLMFILTLSDVYGYRWANLGINTTKELETNGSNGGPMTGGVLTVGDSIHSMNSAMTGDVGIKEFMIQSANGGAVFKNGDASTPTPLTIGLNTPTLTLLEAPDPSIIPASNDPVYTKTIPFIMKLIRTILISGGGPYYNKNRTDSNGNVYTIDGKLYKDSNGVDQIYKESWNTSEYRIKVSNTSNGSCSGGSICKWVGPGGRETNAVVANNSFTPVASGANASGAKGWSIPVWEIAKDNSTERAVNTDEEAIYKNFQWLLHEKRMVAVIPLRASLGNGVPYKMAAFVTVIANGLTGLMNARPVLASGTNCLDNLNAIWKIKNAFLKPGCATPSSKPDFKTPGVPILQENYSDVPGDSLFYLEAWDYGTSGTGPLTFNSLGDASVYSIFYPDPDGYGVLPQVIAANFAVMERLSFLTPDKILPSGPNISLYGKSVDESWEQRNRLLPLILSLAWTLDDQASPSLNKNPFQILTGLSAALTRPLLARIQDPSSSTPGTTIDVVKTVNVDSDIRSNSSTEGEYFFRYLDPITSKPVRSPLSILAENERRYQDGLLNLISRTDLLSTFVQMLAEMGKPERASGAQITFQAIADLMGEIKLSNESPTPIQFNLQAYLGEIRDMVATFPDSRVVNIYDPEWDRLGVWAVRIRDYFDPDSVYSLISTLDFSMDMIIDNVPTNAQLTSVVDLLGGLVRDNTNTQDYLITNLLSVDTADLAQVSAPYGRSTVGVLMGIVKTGEFYSYLETDMRSPHSLKSIFKDAKRLLVSDMIQTQREDESSLIYTAGVLMGIFADLASTGKKQFPDGFVFYDRFNEDENSDTYWDRFVTVFTR